MDIKSNKGELDRYKSNLYRTNRKHDEELQSIHSYRAFCKKLTAFLAK